MADFLIDSYYELYASDFLSSEEIEELTSRQPITPEEYADFFSFSGI